jgi:hypothetical protein
MKAGQPGLQRSGVSREVRWTTLGYVSAALASWKEGAARRALVEFVEQTVSDAVPVEERVAVFDNDGTLWCEKPMPIQLDFILRRLVAMADEQSELRERQPWPMSRTTAGSDS